MRRTLVNTVLLTAAICGLWAAAVYAPTAIINLAKRAGMVQPQAVRIASLGMGLLSLGTILGCLAVPALAERFGRKRTLAFYFLGMAICIVLSFGWAFYLPQGLHPFIAVLFFLGFFGGNFAVFSLWLPEQYGTSVRATAFAFTTSFGRFLAAGVNFAIGATGQPHGDTGQAGCVHRDCLWNRTAGHSLRSRNQGRSPARIDTQIQRKKKGGSLKRAAQVGQVVLWLLEGEYRAKLRAPVGCIADWLIADLGDIADTDIATADCRHRVAGVSAFFKAKLYPGVHLVEDGNSFDRALDGAAAVRANVLVMIEVVALTASIPYAK